MFVCGGGLLHFSSGRGLMVVFLLLGILSFTSSARLGVERQKFEVQKNLNRLKKPVVKSTEVYFLSLNYYLFSENRVSK